MPIVSLRINEELKEKITKRIRTIITKGDLKIDADLLKKCKPGFCMAIQLIPKKQIRSLEFGKPEGLRVFLDADEKTVAAVDFHYSGERLKLMQIYRGKGLKELLGALNQLEELYANKKLSYHVQLISFLLAPGFYLLVDHAKDRQFYDASENEVIPITEKQLQYQISAIIHEHDTQILK